MEWYSLIRVLVKAYLLVSLLALVLSLFAETGSGNIALIRLEGPVTTLPANEGITGDALSAALDAAAANPHVDAIVLRITSPGGSATASMQAAAAVTRAAEVKPVIAYVYDKGLSGAYWIASRANVTIAAPGSLIGSIGVRMDMLTFDGLLAKLGIRYENLSVGSHKNILSPFRNLSDEERSYLLSQLESLHTAFWEDVKTHRNLTQLSPDDVELIKSSLFFTPDQALRLGLIDRIGYEDEVQRVLQEAFTIPVRGYLDYTPGKSVWSTLIRRDPWQMLTQVQLMT